MGEITFPKPYEFVIDVLFIKVWRIDPKVHCQQELDSIEHNSRVKNQGWETPIHWQETKTFPDMRLRRSFFLQVHQA